MEQEQKTRFGGVHRLYGEQNCKRLSEAHIITAGLGGVGSWVVEALARSGVGKLTLIDMDEVCVTNTNRQIQALTENIGKAKVEVLKQRVLSINPDCEVNAVFDFLTPETFDEYLNSDFDYLVDCIDDYRNKTHLISYCQKRRKNILTIGASAGKRDATMIRIDDLTKSINDMLLTRVRKQLRHEYQFPRGRKKFHIPCVFSIEDAYYPHESGEVCQKKPSGTNMKLDCATGMGSITHTTGSFAFVATSFIINEIMKESYVD